MGQDTKIPWAHHTFNPWMGCTKVGPGCDHCYAEALMSNRWRIVSWGAGSPRVRTSQANWRQPRRWNAQARETGVRMRVFCASLADVFDNEVPALWRADLFELITATPHLDWLLLTKRVGNVPRMLTEILRPNTMPPNVWLGITVVSQEELDRDIPKLASVPARVRFLSMEPQLAGVDLRLALATGLVHWVITGGESGADARPYDVAWARHAVSQCRAAGVPVFVKQLGAYTAWDGCAGPDEHWPPGTHQIDTGRGHWRLVLRSPKGEEMSEWPGDLRVREFPQEEVNHA
jgi:protein gp37